MLYTNHLWFLSRFIFPSIYMLIKLTGTPVARGVHGRGQVGASCGVFAAHQGCIELLARVVVCRLLMVVVAQVLGFR
jgi:hypothetical protein